MDQEAIHQGRSCPARYAGQLPASIARATRCQLNLDVGVSGSASSGASGGAAQFGNVYIAPLAGGSNAGTSTGSSNSTVMIIGAVVAGVIALFLLLRRK